MSAFTAIDFSSIAAPSVVETLSYEQILQAYLTDLQARDPVFTALVESDPAYKILEVAAYREVLLRQRINDAARQTMLAYATGTNLDHRAIERGVTRLVIDPGDPEAIPPIPPTLESDDSFRARAQLALEGYSVAGPSGAYIFHALSADPDVKDAAVYSPSYGDVAVFIIAGSGDGSPSGALLDKVQSRLSSSTVRPLTDNVMVFAGYKINYHIHATIKTYPGPDPSVVLANALASVDAFVAQNKRLGYDITLSAIYKALHVEGVQNVNLTSPTANIVCFQSEYAHCTNINVTLGGTAV